MTMLNEVTTLKLKLDTDSLPLTRANLTLCFTIGKPRLYGLHQITNLSCYHPKKKDHTVFIDWLVSQPSKVDRVTIRRTGCEASAT
jgi:hypothetical protein